MNSFSLNFSHKLNLTSTQKPAAHGNFQRARMLKNKISCAHLISRCTVIKCWYNIQTHPRLCLHKLLTDTRQCPQRQKLCQTLVGPSNLLQISQPPRVSQLSNTRKTTSLEQPLQWPDSPILKLFATTKSVETSGAIHTSSLRTPPMMPFPKARPQETEHVQGRLTFRLPGCASPETCSTD